jgi:POT family proton-dependent oligopeptide transporter
LGTAGLHTVSTGSAEKDAQLKSKALMSLGIGVAALALFGVGMATGILPITVAQIVGAYTYVLFGITIGFFIWLFAQKWTDAERKRLYLIVIFFISAAMFWGVFEQAGSTLSLFARDSTRNVVFGWEFPASWWQSLNAMFIFTLAPVFAWLWVKLADRQPSTPTKFALGLIGVGLGFVVLVPGAKIALTGVKVGVGWLFAVYLIHTLAELCLSPVGLSAMTKLAPARIVSQMMGVWFLGASIGNFLGGQAASFYETMPLPTLLLAVAVLPMLAGLGMLAVRKPFTRLGGDAL